jgi:hypothetical protein
LFRNQPIVQSKTAPPSALPISSTIM